MRCRRKRRIGERRHALRIGRDKIDLALIPGIEQFLIRQTADETGMNESGELHAGNVARMRVKAGNIPDRLLRLRKMVGEKSPAVLLRKEAVEAPQALRKRADVEKIDNEQIARLSAFDADRA
jgi:hypothetical protein